MQKINFENYPNMTTPIDENLNEMQDNIEEDINTIKAELDNVTKYITATAGTNGDYFVNITNVLEEGLILNIKFPSAVNGTSNSRLSINNGISYIDIKTRLGNNIRSQTIQNRSLTLYYNGTTYVLMSEIQQVMWTNASPGSSFSSQTINLSQPITDYDILYIIYDVFAPYNNRKVEVTTATTQADTVFSVADYDSSIQIVRRRRSISTSSVTFATGYTNGSTANDRNVPVQIIALKNGTIK